jgi:hypothetical protein
LPEDFLSAVFTDKFYNPTEVIETDSVCETPEGDIDAFHALYSEDERQWMRTL